MTTYQRESVADVLDEIKPLLARHWDEIATFKDLPLDPKYDAYLKADFAGLVRVYTARREGVLVGYGVFFIGNMHYQSSKIATQDLLFLAPEHRGSSIGMRLIRFCDDMLESEGVQVIYQHVKAAHDFGPLLERLGYETNEKLYAKRL